jgi:hypothetical protein
VDVVHQQLDVTRLTEQPGDQGDGGTGGNEDGQLHEAPVVAGAQQALQSVQGRHVGRADETASDPHGDHGGGQALAHVDHGIGERTAGER